MSNVCWFQLLKSKNLLLSLIFIILNEETFGFRQKKQFEGVTLNC